jgi:cytochrome c553
LGEDSTARETFCNACHDDDGAHGNRYPFSDSLEVPN